MAWRNRVEVSYQILRDNLRAIAGAAQGRKVIAVVKADAYGLGLERCARIYHDAGADLLAMANIGEADRVSRAVPQARLLLLSSPLPEERSMVVASGYEVTCSSLEEIQEFAHLAHATHPHPVHVLIDTGMGRFGCPPEEGVALIEAVRRFPELRLAGIATHYAQALVDDVSLAQERCFQQILDAVAPIPDEVLIHAANSEGILARPAIGNAVRAGLLLTGTPIPGGEQLGLKQAWRWLTAVSLVKRLPKGHGISYNHTKILERDSLVAVVPVGYADGYPLALSNSGHVLIHGRRCPILGRITMDYTVVDVTDLPRPPNPGDGVVLVGEQGDERIGIEHLAEWAQTICYDILCGLRGRCEIVGMP